MHNGICGPCPFLFLGLLFHLWTFLWTFVPATPQPCITTCGLLGSARLRRPCNTNGLLKCKVVAKEQPPSNGKDGLLHPGKDEPVTSNLRFMVTMFKIVGGCGSSGVFTTTTGGLPLTLDLQWETNNSMDFSSGRAFCVHLVLGLPLPFGGLLGIVLAFRTVGLFQPLRRPRLLLRCCVRLSWGKSGPLSAPLQQLRLKPSPMLTEQTQT